jgi:hypothetical protein
MLGKKKIILLIGIAIASIAVAAAYIDSPNIASWLNPENRIVISDVTYSARVFRSETVPISITVQNFGSDSKSALVELITKNDPIRTAEVSLSASESKVNTTIWLPIKTAGEQAFTIKVSWVGPGGYCKIEQNSSDKSFLALAADYKTSYSPKFASKAQEFDWELSITNTGNTAADLTVQIAKKDPLIISSADTEKLDNLQVGETRSAVFHFIVPSTANLGDCTITVNLITTYPTSEEIQETTTNNYALTIQESTIVTQLGNMGYIVGALFLALSAGGILTMMRKKRSHFGR